MNSNQISCFLKAAEENNFSRAAEKLYLSQPNLSRSIASLEKELNVKLFIRYSNKSIALTEEGTWYYDFFRQYREELNELRRRCAEQSSFRKELRIGYAVGWNLSEYLPGKVEEFTRRHPDVNIELECYHIDQLQERMENQEIDACITIANSIQRNAKLTVRDVQKLQKIIIFSNRHLQSPVDEITLSDFRGKKVYAFQNSLVKRIEKELASFFKPYGFAPEIKIVPNQETMVSAVENGQGIAVMDLWSQPAQAKDISWIPLPYAHQVVFAYPKDSDNPYMEEFYRILCRA